MKQNSSATNPIPGGLKTDPVSLLRRLRTSYWVPVSGSSMKPLLRDGDLVFVQPFAVERPTSVKTGTLILFTWQDQLIVHRAIGRKGDYLIEKGDYSPESRLIPFEDILGTVIARRRNNQTSTISIPLKWRLLSLLQSIRGDA